jgi:hypothetical protein
MTRLGEIAGCFGCAGLEAVEEKRLTMRMDFESFEDYWRPQITGQSDTAEWLESLPHEQQPRIRAAV